MRYISLAASILASFVVAGCVTQPKPSTSVTAFQAEKPIAPEKVDTVEDFQKAAVKFERPATSASSSSSGSLRGRTLRISSIGDIRLGAKEVVLTFDDGPAPGKTETILKTLDDYGVKATFLMVGSMAKAHPRLARSVAARGHSIGSHTYNHANLRTKGFDAAVNDITRGESAIRSAGVSNIKFFRFPYLADTGALRSHLASRGTVVLDVDVDSKDYFKVSPASVVNKTMSSLRAQGKGIILMHDLHGRTASALPTLLRRLKDEGYKVVHLAPGGNSGGGDRTN
ncbi:MAG: polysaccharide deacetylase family protein [Ahrensia sp.]|nr:polysaccharide deacetylase family protein [Ahrensia sp.]